MSQIDEYVMHQARAELRPGEVLFASGWMMKGGRSVGGGMEEKIRRFIAAATSQRLLIIEVKGSLMGGPSTSAINKYWIELNQLTDFRAGFGLIKLAAVQDIAFSFANGYVDAFSIPKMGRGMDGQKDFYYVLPKWLESHFQRGGFQNPDAAPYLAQEVANLGGLRQTYAPKLVGKPKHQRIIKWPWVLAVVAFAVAGLGFHLAGGQKDRKSFYDDLAAQEQRTVDELSKIAKTKRTKKESDKLERAKRRVADNEDWSRRAASKIGTSRLVSGGGITAGVLFVALAIFLQRRRVRSPE